MYRCESGSVCCRAFDPLETCSGSHPSFQPSETYSFRPIRISLPSPPIFTADTDEAVHFVQSEAVQAFRFQAVYGSEVKSSTSVPLFGSVMDGG